MRGGALPVLVWAGILALLFAGNWVWAGDPVQVAEFGFAVLVIVLAGLLLTVASREAVHKGAPPPAQGTEVRSLPSISAGAALVAVGAAAAAFGLTFGHFIIYFGAGLFVVGAGRLAIELRAERKSVEELAARSPLHGGDGGAR